MELEDKVSKADWSPASRRLVSAPGLGWRTGSIPR